MRNYNHYVPILRSKQAEWNALLDLKNSNTPTSSITPLLELVPTSFVRKNKKTKQKESRQPEYVLKEISKNIFRYWGRMKPIFLDGWHIEQKICLASSHPLIYLGNHARGFGLKIVPVTGLDNKRTDEYQHAVKSLVKQGSEGVCIRLLINDIYSDQFGKNLNSLLKRLDIQPCEADLVIDYQLINDSVPTLVDLCKDIPDIIEWRSFILASGSFFKYASEEIEKYAHCAWPRKDWLFWKDQVTSSDPHKRLPSYGDYTIQYAYYEEPPDGAIPGAKIIYTCDKYWLVTRGDQLKDKDEYEQFPAFAQLFCERDEFRGEGFSAGDHYIYSISQEMLKPDDEVKNTGNAATWLQASINGHITFAIYQLANLSFS